jgi:hypothetical protein
VVRDLFRRPLAADAVGVVGVEVDTATSKIKGIVRKLCNHCCAYPFDSTRYNWL